MAELTGTDAASRFRALHQNFFATPNPWDGASARHLASQGFKALATSSAALAWSLGKRDGGITRAEAIAHAAMIGAQTGLPVNGDFESGYGETPAEVGETIRAAMDAGVAGCSIEDVLKGGIEPLYSEADACRRLEAARNAIDSGGGDFVLTGRCEAYLEGVANPFEVVKSRLKAYAEAGSDVLYAPGLTDPEEVAALVALTDRPLSVIAGAGGVSNDLGALAALGVKRVTVGSALYKKAFGTFFADVGRLCEGSAAFGTMPPSDVFDALMPESGV
ncbi:isocitrate lyase/phosphoenolpyruvate mutase family protein [Acuticoccus sp. MNP-M23]|uniref:isocitrate lyase/PEP mutase family protein n=1 Tax=Acuticoccus sp. MNP-M23 TaxID=3072793 RepID=UPI0028165156|nr:isocitrate lyase/phosphoenolpyruvate mutase family protein [Acuticoccus sp. MNP-M23]WMS42837.1 isocitrate lyase/phosphoenolpyruvate mutase family protein [Acuticoccus sp. MNP-M23]